MKRSLPSPVWDENEIHGGGRGQVGGPTDEHAGAEGRED